MARELHTCGGDMRNLRRDTHEHEAGFTLTEMVVVVGLMAIMTAVAVPSIMNFLKNYSINGAAQMVAGELNRARAKAIASNTTNGVVFVTGVNAATNQFQYWLEDSLTLPGSKPAVPQVGVNLTGTVQVLPLGISFVTQTGTNWVGRGIRFSRLGRPCATGRATG